MGKRLAQRESRAGDITQSALGPKSQRGCRPPAYPSSVVVLVIGQDYLSAGLQSVVAETTDINTQLDKRAKTLRSLFSTKDVLPENKEGWYRLHRDMLVHHEVNAYLAAATSWEKLLEVTFFSPR